MDRTSSASAPHVIGVLVVLLFGLSCHHASPLPENRGDDAKGPSKRMRVAVLFLENQTGDPNLAHWSYTCSLFMGFLGHVQVLYPLPSGAIEYAFQKMGLHPGDPIDPDVVCQMGREIEAQRVVWGSYQKTNGQWHVDLRVLNVATEAVSPTLSATAGDWFDIRDTLNEQLLTELEVTPTAPEARKMADRLTDSPEALHWLLRALLSQDQVRPVAEQEAFSRKALAADPNFAWAYIALASTLANQGDFDSAENMAQKALKLRPDEASTHTMVGCIYAAQKQWDLGIEQLLQALQLDPDDTDSLTKLATFYSAKGQWDKTIVLLRRTVSLDPTDAFAHASLAAAYATLKRRDEALSAIADARFYMPRGVGTLSVWHTVARTYELLGKPPEAIECYQQIASIAREWAIDPAQIRAIDRRIRGLKSLLKPTFIQTPRPKHYPPEALEAILREKLSEQERQLIVDPFACTEPMRQWAQDLTRDAKTDLDKAKALFNGLAVRHSVPGQTANRTAREVFAAWKDTNTRLVCADHAVLLVALARAVGLDAFYVLVTRGPDGMVFWHACVAIFFEDRVLLVDSAQQWFGIPHQEYTILDDLQAVAHRGFVNRQNSFATVAACRAALKLWPDSMSTRLNLAYALLATQRLDEAQAVLDDIGQPPATDAMAGGYWCCRGQLAMYRHEWDEVKSCMHEAVSLYPGIKGAYKPLAIVYWQEGRLAEARAAFRAALRNDSNNPKDVRFARRAIAQINEQIGFDEVADTVPDETIPTDVPADSEAKAGD